MKKIFILSDGQGWIVDRTIEKMVALLSVRFEFIHRFYTQISTQELVETANGVDLTYYSNWDFSYHLGHEDEINKPFLLGIRSHRYAGYVKMLATKFYIQVNNPMLLKDFPNATCIPDGVPGGFSPDHDFKVGMAFQEMSREYKGYYLVKQACDELGIELKVATDLPSDRMREFYESVDLVVIASIAEGFGAIAMECAMMNKPFITTDVGIPHLINCHKCERTVESIKNEISKFYTYPQVNKYDMVNVCDQFAYLFNKLCA